MWRAVETGAVLCNPNRQSPGKVRLDSCVCTQGDRAYTSPAAHATCPAAEDRTGRRGCREGNHRALREWPAAVSTTGDPSGKALDTPLTGAGAEDGQRGVSRVQLATDATLGIEAVAVVIRSELHDFSPEAVIPLVPAYG